MTEKKENDFVVSIKTPTSSFSQRVSLGDLEVKSKCTTPKNHRSPNSVTYSDSFDESPVKTLKGKRGKNKRGNPVHKSTTLRCKISTKGSNTKSRVKPTVVKSNETTQKLMESHQLKINDLLSENADYQRQIQEKIKELKTLQSQNKIQEKHLKKINSRDADVPNIISRYNSEIRSLHNLLRKNKEKLDSSNKINRNLEIELSRVKLKNEKLNTLCEDNELHSRDELAKRIQTLQESLEAESKRRTELERSIELLTKKHSHQLGVEAGKFKDLNQSYKEAQTELRDIRCLLKEKTKLLEMQNIYSKIVARPPHHIVGSIGDTEDQASSSAPSKVATQRKTALQVKEKRISERNNEKAASILTKPRRLQASVPSTKTLIEVENNMGNVRTQEDTQLHNQLSDTRHEDNKDVSHKNNPPEGERLEEPSNKFSELHDTVRKSMKDREAEDADRAQKNDLIAKLKYIDEAREACDLEYPDDVKDQFDLNKMDVFCSSQSDGEQSLSNSDLSSSCLLHHRTLPGMNTCRNRLGDSSKGNMSNFEFLGFSLNANHSKKVNFGLMLSGSDHDDDNPSGSDCERVDLD